MATVLKIVGSEWENASRDKRELSVYEELGFKVVVMAKGKEKDKGYIDNVDGFKVLRYSTRPLGSKFSKNINRFVSLFLWAYYARKLKPDVISGHDLMPGLVVAWISTWFQKNKPKLIYDSHEFEIGRNAKRGHVLTFFLKEGEKYLMKKCAFSIMVNDSIADEVQRIHHLKKRPIVIRNIPNYWSVDDNICKVKRQEFIMQFAKMEKSHGKNMG